MANILVVDDELGIRDLLSEILIDEGHTVEVAENATQARQARIAAPPDLVLLDIWMPDTDGVSLLKEWRSNDLLTMPVIMMSGHATIDIAVDATRLGATGFLEKPITLKKLLKVVQIGLRQSGIFVGHRRVVKSEAPEASEVSDTSEPKITESSDDEVALSIAERVFSLEGSLREAKDVFEREYFTYHLEKESGSMTRVALKTGLERTHLYRKFKQLGISVQQIKEGRKSKKELKKLKTD